MISQIIQSIENPLDREFMETLYLTYNRLIYSEIYKILENEWDTEDVLQTTLINLIGKASYLRTLERDRLVNYIISTAHNTSYNFLRAHKRVQEFSFDEALDFVVDTGMSGEDRLIRIEEIEDVDAAWKAIDMRSRLLLEMKYILEKSDAEIALEIGVNKNSVRMLLSRARDKLKAKVTA